MKQGRETILGREVPDIDNNELEPLRLLATIGIGSRSHFGT